MGELSQQIILLYERGLSRSEIASKLGIRYQQVRYYLLKAGIQDGLTLGNNNASVRLAKPELKPVSDDRSPPPSWEVLLKAGFQYIGDWGSEEGKLALDRTIPDKPGVYALIVDNEVKYIGLTLRGLSTRMSQYRRGHKGQRTSARVNELITRTVSVEHKKVKLLILMPEDTTWNELPLNVSAGLEAGLIQMFSPEWNIQGKNN